MRTTAIVFLATISLPVSAASEGPPLHPPGTPLSASTNVLKAGAAVLQKTSPLGPMDIYLNGFHPMKDDPAQQMVAYHFCSQVNEDFAQCALFDANTRDANLTGVEYIISEKLFNTLPEEEKPYWHPHNYEILSGQLLAPGLPGAAEKALMKAKLNSYGKTWHLWNTGSPGHQGDPLPVGVPQLAWSFNHDGEAQPGLVERRDQRLDTASLQKRDQRAELRPLAHPQRGVEALRGKFPRPTQPLPGVAEAASSSAPQPVAPADAR